MPIPSRRNSFSAACFLPAVWRKRESRPWRGPSAGKRRGQGPNGNSASTSTIRRRCIVFSEPMTSGNMRGIAANHGQTAHGCCSTSIPWRIFFTPSRWKNVCPFCGIFPALTGSPWVTADTPLKPAFSCGTGQRLFPPIWTRLFWKKQNSSASLKTIVWKTWKSCPFPTSPLILSAARTACTTAWRHGRPCMK